MKLPASVYCYLIDILDKNSAIAPHYNAGHDRIGITFDTAEQESAWYASCPHAFFCDLCDHATSHGYPLFIEYIFD